jgi:cytochrome o ubiquinol oxidase subunit 3
MVTGAEVLETASYYLLWMAVLFAPVAVGMGVLTWWGMTFLLGAGFIALEINVFHLLISVGFGPSRSGFLSGFFTLVGTHGLHVTSGLIWMAIMMYQVQKNGLTATNKTRLSCLSLFWHFLDVVWICVFTVVYLMGTM